MSASGGKAALWRMLQDDLAHLDPIPPRAKLAGMPARDALSPAQQADFAARYDGTVAVIMALASEYQIPRNQCIAWAQELGCRNRVSARSVPDAERSEAELLAAAAHEDTGGIAVTRDATRFVTSGRGLRMLLAASAEGGGNGYAGNEVGAEGADADAASGTADETGPGEMEAMEMLAEMYALTTPGASDAPATAAEAEAAVVTEDEWARATPLVAALAPALAPLVAVPPDPTPAIPASKWCASCQQLRPASDFGPNRGNKNGLASYCRACRNAPAAARTVEALDIGQTKVCRRCGRERSVALFRAFARNPDGFAHTCRACSGARAPMGLPPAVAEAVATAAVVAAPAPAVLPVARVGELDAVNPVEGATVAVIAAPAPERPPERAPAEGDDAAAELGYRLLRRMLDDLPPARVWTLAGRTRWLRAFVGIVDYLIAAEGADDAPDETEATG